MIKESDSTLSSDDMGSKKLTVHEEFQNRIKKFNKEIKIGMILSD